MLIQELTYGNRKAAQQAAFLVQRSIDRYFLHVGSFNTESL